MKSLYAISLITIFCLSMQSHAMQQQIQPTLSPELKQHMLKYRTEEFYTVAEDNNPQAMVKRKEKDTEPPLFWQDLKKAYYYGKKKWEIRRMDKDPQAVFQETITHLIQNGTSDSLHNIVSLYNPSETEKSLWYNRAKGTLKGKKKRYDSLPTINKDAKLISGATKSQLGTFILLCMDSKYKKFLLGVPLIISGYKDGYQYENPTEARDTLHKSISHTRKVTKYLENLKPHRAPRMDFAIIQAMRNCIKKGNVAKLNSSCIDEFDEQRKIEEQEILRYIKYPLEEAYYQYEKHSATTDLWELPCALVDASANTVTEAIKFITDLFPAIKTPLRYGLEKAANTNGIESDLSRIVNTWDKQSNITQAQKVLKMLQKIKSSITPKEHELFEKQDKKEERQRQATSLKEEFDSIKLFKLIEKAREEREEREHLKCELLAKYEKQQQKVQKRREFWWNVLKALPEHPGIL